MAPDDAAAMSAAVLTYLNDEALAQQTGDQGRRYAELAFEIGGIADRFERLFERLRAGPPRAGPPRQRQQPATASAPAA